MFFIKQAVNILAAFINAMTVVLLFWIPAMAQTTTPGNILKQSVLGEHKILFIRVQYPGDEGGIVSDAAMENVAAVVKETLETNSYGAVTVTID
ncbi:MAG: hypothetical protein ACE5G1_17710, partial [bacterium]